MKRVAVFLCVVMIIVGTAGIASALPYYEEYTGRQKVREGKSYNFGFDLWFDNEYFDSALPKDRVGTNSKLKLTQDSMGALGEYSSITLQIDLFSKDKRAENVDIMLSSGNAWGIHGESFELETFNWNGNRRNGKTHRYSYELTFDELYSFERWGWGNVNIAANGDGKKNRRGRRANDFSVKRVAFAIETATPGDVSVNSTLFSAPPDPVTPVPEPATLLLLGTGLASIAAIGRKRKRVIK